MLLFWYNLFNAHLMSVVASTDDDVGNVFNKWIITVLYR